MANLLITPYLLSHISQGVDGIALCGFEGLNANGEQGC